MTTVNGTTILTQGIQGPEGKRGQKAARLQVLATRGQLPVGLEGGTPNNYTRMESQVAFQTGPQAVTGPRLIYANFFMQQGGLGETVGAHDYTLESSMLVPTAGNANPIFFNGRKRPAIDAGAPFIISDANGFNLPANTTVLVRSGAIVSSGGTIPAGLKLKHTGWDRMASSTAGSSQVYTNASFATPSGGAVSTYGFMPVALIGIPEHETPSVAIVGDSIAYGVSDTNDGNGNSGYVERGLWNVHPDGSPMPFVNLSVSGGALYFAGNSNSPRFRALFEYVTHVLFTVGINDIASRTLTQMQNDAQTYWRSARQAGCKVYQTLITPRTNAGNTAPFSANFQPGGLREQFNNWIKTQKSAGLLDDFIDLNSILEDQNNYGLWADNAYSPDGLHPGPAGNIAAKGVINAWAKTLHV